MTRYYRDRRGVPHREMPTEVKYPGCRQPGPPSLSSMLAHVRPTRREWAAVMSVAGGIDGERAGTRRGDASPTEGPLAKLSDRLGEVDDSRAYGAPRREGELGRLALRIACPPDRDTCRACGAVYTPAVPGQRFCGERCQDRYWKARKGAA